jgi:hypothetical protein
MAERGLEVMVGVIHADQRSAQGSRRAGVVGLLGDRFTSDEAGLEDDARRLLERLDAAGTACRW